MCISIYLYVKSIRLLLINQMLDFIYLLWDIKYVQYILMYARSHKWSRQYAYDGVYHAAYDDLMLVCMIMYMMLHDIKLTTTHCSIHTAHYILHILHHYSYATWMQMHFTLVCHSFYYGLLYIYSSPVIIQSCINTFMLNDITHI